MIYDLVHITAYKYAQPVDIAQCVLRHQPVNRPNQRVVASVLKLTPEPQLASHALDFFGNRIVHASFTGLHEALIIEARSRILVDLPQVPPTTPSCEEVRALAAISTDMSAASPVHFLFGSRHVPLLAQALAFGAPFAGLRRPVLDVAIDISNCIHDSFIFDPEASDVSTPLAQTLVARRGVCQDFAHVMLASLRSLGLPAAYVSGYLRTLPPPGKRRLVGADASHAWVMVWCGPDAGWVGIDPTNRRLAGTDHIVSAIGRDYADIAPVDGIVRANGKQRLRVSVDVQEVAV